jgi:fructosamine-3-kinase
VDLAYLRTHPHHLPTFLTHQRIRETPVGGGSICTAMRLTLDDGASVFAKSWPGGPPPSGFFAAEAAGLRWLAEAGAPVPEVLAELPDMLVLEWIDPGPATPDGAHAFGRALAALHRAGAPRFGTAWPAYIGALPLPETTGERWPEWFAQARLAPFLGRSADRGALSAADVGAVEDLLTSIRRYAGEAADEPPARIHGDLWPGNLLWSSTGTGYLIDPAAQGGHRETDLATLMLWGGVPHLDRVLAGYEEVYPLAPGWRARVPLHQLHLLLVHTALFGEAYRGAVMSAVRATVKG